MLSAAGTCRVGHPRAAIALFVAAAAAVLAAMIVWDLSPVRRGELPDADSYMRLVRVMRLHDTASWYDDSLPRSNAPYGETSNWTRPLDVLMLGPALALQSLVGFRAALFWVGALISPLLLIVGCVTMAWGTKPLWGDDRHLWVMPALFSQLALLTYSSPGRADHHTLIALGNIVELSCGIRLVLGRRNGNASLATGMAGAFAIWVSPEGVFFLVPIVLALAVQWVMGEDEAAAKVWRMSMALAAGLAIAMVVERPPGRFLVVEHDKVSLVHFLAALTAAGAGAAAMTMARHARARLPRVAVLLGLAWAGGLLVAWVAPGFWRGSLEGANPGFEGTFMPRNAEFQSQFPIDPRGLVFCLEMLGTSALVLPYAIYRARLARGDRSFAMVAALAVTLVGCVAMGLFHLRLSIYPEIIAAVFCADLVVRISAAGGGVVSAPLAAAALCLGPLALAVAVQTAYPAATAGPVGKHSFSLTAMSDYLEPRRAPGTSPIILAQFPSLGTELLYRTGYSVVAAPDHRGWEGIRDELAAWNAASDDSVRAIVERRGVALVLLCRRAGDLDVLDPGRDPATTFYGRLHAGRVPAWLEPVPLPPALARDFCLYEVEGRWSPSRPADRR